MSLIPSISSSPGFSFHQLSPLFSTLPYPWFCVGFFFFFNVYAHSDPSLKQTLILVHLHPFTWLIPSGLLHILLPCCLLSKPMLWLFSVPRVAWHTSTLTLTILVYSFICLPFHLSKYNWRILFYNLVLESNWFR